MISLSSIDDIERLYAARGGLRYGEGVTQIEHALQCAALAKKMGGAQSLVAAAFLHDVGHLFDTEEQAMASGLDDRHEVSGAKALASLFGEPVWKPVALHVLAKRYLCFKEPAYFAALSPASKSSLELQGGILDAEKVAGFERLPYWQDAVTLRRIDDMGKREDMCGLAFADFLPLLHDLSAAVE